MSKKLVAVLGLLVLLFTLFLFESETECNFTTGAVRESLYFAGIQVKENPLAPSQFELILVDAVALGLPAEDINWRKLRHEYLIPVPWHRTRCNWNFPLDRYSYMLEEAFRQMSAVEAVATKGELLVMLNRNTNWNFEERMQIENFVHEKRLQY